MAYQAANNQESPYATLAEAYTESHPDVTITLSPQPNDSYSQNLRTQLQAGNAPDVVQTSPGSGQGNGVVTLAEAGFLEPLDDRSSGVVPAGSEDLFGRDGTVYGQPMELTVVASVFNRAGARAAGVAEFPADWPGYLAACRAARAEGTSMLALAGSAPPNTGMMAMSISASRVFAQDPDWNTRRSAGEVTFADSPGWSDTLETVLEMDEAGCFQPGAEAGGFDAITNGLGQNTSFGAFVPSATALEIEKAAPDTDLVIEPFPVADQEPWVLASSNYSLSINAASDQKAAAQEFLDWVAEPEQAKAFAEASGALPVTGYADLDLSGTIYAPVADLLASGSFSPLPNNGWPDAAVYDALGTGVQGLLTGQTTVQDVLRSMDAAWDE
ncbi:ABC transporter substrate-binding protein [Kineococcus sp. SYSU DK001]|uniref:ABC transporter substrate-binding protein n=1 Tax=Kineococcus sp. SYSU DK001 TaxID=3383122 RepID=UPI003D7DD106